MNVADDEPSYSFKPSLMGAPWVFWLRPDGLHWLKGTREGRVAYCDITRVRMSFRPMTVLFNRYRIEIWSKGTPRIEIVSASAKNMVEQERQGPAYTKFVTELHRRLMAVPARFDAGSPFLLYWAGATVFASVALAICALVVRALQTGAWGGAGLIVLFLGVFVWQAIMFFRRNVPGTYRPDSLPTRLLPVR